MCVVSAVGDNWGRTVPDRFPWTQPDTTFIQTPPSREEFNALKREMQELKKLLIAAKEFDEATGQPDCHADEKVELIKKLAELVGVDLKDIFGESND